MNQDATFRVLYVCLGNINIDKEVGDSTYLLHNMTKINGL